MTVKLKNLNLTEQHLVDVTTTELHEINGGRIGQAKSYQAAKALGANDDAANKAAMGGGYAGGAIGAVGGGIIGGIGGVLGGLRDENVGPLFGGIGGVATGGVAGGDIGSSLAG